jgi:hypothetical protein
VARRKSAAELDPGEKVFTGIGDVGWCPVASRLEEGVGE